LYGKYKRGGSYILIYISIFNTGIAYHEHCVFYTTGKLQQ
jgi:hypothetical protein